MSGSLSRRALTSCLLCLLAAPATARAEPIATISAPTPLEAFDGRLIWSTRQADGTFRLTQLAGGRVTQLPVAGSSVPFDVDLGPDARGKPIAVYSRCRVPPPVGSSPGGRAIYSRGRGCRLHSFSFAAGRERRLPRASGRSEYLPTVWRGRLAYFSSPEKGARNRRRASLYIRPFGARKRGARLAVGSRGITDPSFDAPAPIDTDLRARRVVFTWGGVWTTRACPGTGDDRYVGDQLRTEAWTVTLGGERRRLARACQGLSGPRLSSAALSATAATFLRSRGVGGRLIRVGSRRGDIARQALPPGSYEVAAAGRRLYVLRATDGGFVIESL